MLLLAGHTQEAYLALVALLLYALFQTVFDLFKLGPSVVVINAAVTLLMLAAGVALSAAQLLPTIELTSWSIRSGGMSYAEATNSSLNAKMLFDALLPPFWNRELAAQPGESEFMGYVGILPIALMLTGVLSRRRRYTLFFAGLAVLGLFLALGKQNPIYPQLFRIVPGFDTFRVPARWLFLYSFGASMLAGLGAEALLYQLRRWWWLAVYPGLRAGPGRWRAKLVPFEHLPPAMTQSSWQICGGIAVVLMLGAISGGSPKVWGVLFVLATIGELWLAGQSMDYAQPLPTDVFTQHKPGAPIPPAATRRIPRGQRRR